MLIRLPDYLFNKLIHVSNGLLKEFSVYLTEALELAS